MKSVLISGASIAGPATAFWLAKFGYTVTVVERSKALRLGGQNIDIKGAAKEVAEKMGIYEEVEAAHTGEKGTVFVNADNEVTARFDQGEVGGLTSELEILRGDLVEILYKHTKEDVHYRFGDCIKQLEEDGNGVTVQFESGHTERFDLVIGADGQRSALRQLVFGDEPELNYLGIYTSYLTIPKGPNDSDWARWYVAPDSRNILLRPDNKGTTRASLNFLSPEDKDYGRLPLPEQKALLTDIFQNAGWETDRILQAMHQTDDVFLDACTQVNAPRWSKGRVALVGDAAYCATPISGKGTALAMIGAYILANELNAAIDHEQVFAAYDKKLRPYVEKVQKFPAAFVKLAYPSSKLGVYLLNTFQSVLASNAFQSIAGIFKGDEKADEDDFELPEYVRREMSNVKL